MRRQRPRHTGQIVAALAVLLSACGGQSAQTVGEYTIYVHDPSIPSGGEDALVGGTLMIRSGCVLLGEPDADVAYPVIWPSGTSIVDDDPLTLETPDGGRLTLGDVVIGSGGFHEVGDGQVEVEISDQCLGEFAEVAVFNAGADLTVDP